MEASDAEQSDAAHIWSQGSKHPPTAAGTLFSKGQGRGTGRAAQALPLQKAMKSLFLPQKPQKDTHMRPFPSYTFLILKNMGRGKRSAMADCHAYVFSTYHFRAV
jgi:hypothetical protein